MPKRGYTSLIDDTVSVKRFTESFPVTHNIATGTPGRVYVWSTLETSG